MQNNQDETKEIKSNSGNKLTCPPKLKEFIDLANLLPRTFYVLPNERDVTKYAFDVLGRTDEDGRRVTDSGRIIEAYQHFYKDYPQEIKNYIFEFEDLAEVKHRVSVVKSLFEGLIQIGYINQTDLPLKDAYEGMDELFSEFQFNIPITITMDSKGYLRAKSNSFIEFITENKIRADRIRICEVCENLFWASRSDMKTCQKSCANAFRQQRWRERNKETYNKQRKSNYAYKKQLKEKQNQEERNQEDGAV